MIVYVVPQLHAYIHRLSRSTIYSVSVNTKSNDEGYGKEAKLLLEVIEVQL